MYRLQCVGLLALLICIGGCTNSQAYVDVSNETRANYKEMADIIEKVEDEKSMAEAKAALAQRWEHMERCARKAQALPRPIPPDAKERMEANGFIVQRSMDRIRMDLERIRKLPGGEDFFKYFESKTQNLMQAVQP